MNKNIHKLKYLFVRNAPEFQLISEYNQNQCEFIKVIDSNIIQVALKTLSGWARFKLQIMGLDIIKTNLISTCDYIGLIERLIKYQDLIIKIDLVNSNFNILYGDILIRNIDNISLSYLLNKYYTQYLILGIPISEDNQVIKDSVVEDDKLIKESAVEDDEWDKIISDYDEI